LKKFQFLNDFNSPTCNKILITRLHISQKLQKSSQYIKAYTNADQQWSLHVKNLPRVQSQPKFCRPWLCHRRQPRLWIT